MRRSVALVEAWLGPLCFTLAGVACSASSQGEGSQVGVEPPPPAGGSDGEAAPPADAPPIAGVDPGVTFGTDLGCSGGCAFPLEPIFDDSLDPIQADEVARFDDLGPFADPATSVVGSVCVLEPHLGLSGEPGALYPKNWLRPRLRWVGAGDEELWEVRLSTESEPSDLVLYTRATQWVMPDEMWRRLTDDPLPITVVVRGISSTGVVSGYRGTFSIAPVEARGSLVFWSTVSSIVSPTSSRLQGFAVGDEAVVQTLTATDVLTEDIIGENGAVPRGFYPYVQQGQDNGFVPGEVECVGCHVSTPDGEAVVFTDNWPWNKVVASIQPGSRGSVPDYMTDAAVAVLKQPWLGMQALSPAHFAPGDRIVLTSYGVRADTGERGDPNDQNRGFDPYDPAFAGGTGPTRHRLAWFDLEATVATPIPDDLPPFTDEEGVYYGAPEWDQRRRAMGAAFGVAYGFVETRGELRSAVTPSWTHDGTEIAYVSTDLTSSDGHPDWRSNVADIMVVPYAGRAGGDATPLAGASDPDFLEYYPEYSSDDAFVAFTRAPNPSVAQRCAPTQAQPVCAPQDLGANPDGPYYNRNGEIYVVPRGGGQPERLVANDPPACSGQTSSGIINSWPKWSPDVFSAGGKKYYFLIFSSARAFEGQFDLPADTYTPPVSNKSSQLYLAALTVDEQTGAVTTYPAIYLWNQNLRVDAEGNALYEPTSNLTPAWDNFSIPEVPPPVRIPF